MEKICKKYVCVCGKEFDNSGSYGAHVRFCEVYKSHKENLKNIEETYEYVCECGRRFKTKSSLALFNAILGCLHIWNLGLVNEFSQSYKNKSWRTPARATEV